MHAGTPAVCLLLCLRLAAPVLASSPASIPAGIQGDGPSSITVDIKCRIAEIDAANSSLVLVDLETETPHELELEDSVKLRARSKKQFGGRKKLSFADLRVGQELKVTVYVADGSIRKITVVNA